MNELWGEVNGGATTASYRVESFGTWNTPHLSGTIENGRSSFVDKHEKFLHPRLYFRYLKSKFTLLESRFFRSRIKQLEKMSLEYSKLGQEALSEECIKQFIVLSREAAMLACGIKYRISEEHIDKFRRNLKIPLKVTPIKNFVRPLPKKITQKVKKCVDKKLFDEYLIFHLDNRQTKETEKERIERERDPIIFGKVQYSPDFYYIADWIDEEDDLTLDALLKKISLRKSNIKLTMRPLKRKE